MSTYNESRKMGMKPSLRQEGKLSRQWGGGQWAQDGSSVQKGEKDFAKREKGKRGSAFESDKKGLKRLKRHFLEHPGGKG